MGLIDLEYWCEDNDMRIMIWPLQLFRDPLFTCLAVRVLTWKLDRDEARSRLRRHLREDMHVTDIRFKQFNRMADDIICVKFR